MERYGWEKFKNEGLQELERIASSQFFAGKDQMIYLLRKYIELYKADADLKNQIQGTIFYPDIAKKNEKAARDKASRQIIKLRQLLQDFYNSDEGKESAYRIYFVSDERDYRIGVEPRAKDANSEYEIETRIAPPTYQEKIETSLLSQRFDLPRIKEMLLDFLKIYPEVWLMPKSLVARSKASGTFNWDAIGVFLFSTILVVVTSRHYFSSFKSYVETSNIHPVLISDLVNQLAKIEKPFESLLSSELVFAIFRFGIFATVVPWVLYNKIFKGNATISSIINFQFYFIMCWVPIAVLILFAAMNLIIHNIVLTFLGLFTALLGGWVLWLCYHCLYKLSGFTWKKGILPSIIYFCAYLWFFKTFF